MWLELRGELPFVTVTVGHGGTIVEVPDVLVDTGSASTLLNAEVAASLGIVPEPHDQLRTLCGVGGREVVFVRCVDQFVVGGRAVHGFAVEIGGLDYGFALNGILGMDLLTAMGAVINLRDLTLECA